MHVFESVNTCTYSSAREHKPGGTERRVLLVGPPGAGKTSQGTLLASQLGVPHLSTGTLLRDEVRRGTPVGRRANEYMRAGALVPDGLVQHVLERRLGDAVENGVVLDGYPRTLEQAQRFVRSLGDASLDLVIELAVSDDVVVTRLAGRSSGNENKLDRRSDDDEHVVRARLLTHAEQTSPMLDYFAKAGILVTIDGDRPEHDIAADLVQLVV